MANLHQQSNIANSVVPAGLLEQIMLRIDAERKTIAMRRRFVLAAISFLAFSASAIPVWKYFQTNITQSGFSQYLTLIFYDFKIVTANWQDYTLSLLESLPVISTVALLAVILALLAALKVMVQYSKSFFSISHFHPKNY